MAQDKGSTIENQEIDLDDIEVVILVIAKSPKNLGSAAAFLNRRGWPTTVMSNLSQALEFATDKKPDFVLVSMNHPNPALLKFSELLTNTFGTTCVAFAERMDSASNSKLNKSRIEQKIQGQSSGPNLHRSLRKILAKKLNINLDEKGGQTHDRTKIPDGNSRVTVKGGQADDDQMIMQDHEAGATHNKAPTYIKGEDSHVGGSEGRDTEVVSTGKYTMTTKNRRSLKDIAQQSNRLETSDNMTSGNSEDLAARLKKSLFGESPEAAQDRDLEAGVSNSKNSRSADSDGGTGFRAMDVQAGSNSDRESSDGGSNSRRFSKSIGGSELDAAGAQSLIERAVHTTLERVCRLSSEDPAPIELIEQVGVLPIDSNNLWGYLVLAWPNDEIRAKEAFFKLTQKILQLVFNEMGVQARLEPGFFVTIPEVEFVSWSQEQAAFSFSTAHGNEEIGVAYFPTSKPFPKPREVEDKSMCSIGLENISTEQPVTFKVYLHMKKNKKYFLYLRNGRSLQPEQKERLKDGNVKDLYMKSIDVENLRMFLAACHLREKIKGSGEEAA